MPSEQPPRLVDVAGRDAAQRVPGGWVDEREVQVPDDEVATDWVVDTHTDHGSGSSGSSGSYADGGRFPANRAEEP